MPRKSRSEAIQRRREAMADDDKRNQRLFLGIVAPAAAAALVLNTTPDGVLSALQIGRLLADLAVIICSTLVLANTSD